MCLLDLLISVIWSQVAHCCCLGLLLNFFCLLVRPFCIPAFWTFYNLTLRVAVQLWVPCLIYVCVWLCNTGMSNMSTFYSKQKAGGVLRNVLLPSNPSSWTGGQCLILLRNVWSGLSVKCKLSKIGTTTRQKNNQLGPQSCLLFLNQSIKKM